MPLPILVADSHSAADNESDIITAEGDSIPLNNVMFEFSPCMYSVSCRLFRLSDNPLVEMGSFDPPLSAFTPTKFLGTTNASQCITGFDQISFIAGTSSDDYNMFNTSVRKALVYIVKS